MAQLPNNSSSFSPVLPTPTSIGQTYHKQSFETDGLTNHVNINNDASGNWTGSSGGFNFATINSTLATPIPLATIDISGITITKDGIGPSSLLPLPNILNSIDIAINTVSPINVPPYNMTPTGTIWEVQVNSNCTNMTTGITYYAKVFSNTTLQLNTSPDGGIPTIIDTADLASRPQPILSLVDAGPPITNTSILSATDLTFDNVSLQSTLRDLQIKQITTTNQNISAVITADGRPPIPPSVAFAQQYAFNPSWYFKNSFSSGVNKINWYLGPSIGMTVSQLEGVYMNIFNGLTTSNDNTPYIIIFTANDTAPLYYKSKRTYIFNQSVQPIADTRYLMYANVSGTCPTPNYYGSVLNNLELSTVAGSQVGAFGPTELIFAFSIHTNSGSPLNSVEFAINKFGIMTNNFATQEVLFIPS